MPNIDTDEDVKYAESLEGSHPGSGI